MVNRLPNLVFIAIQIPLLVEGEVPSIPALIRGRRSGIRDRGSA
jgi:hypothetical protein